jgi:hypothetical protein
VDFNHGPGHEYATLQIFSGMPYGKMVVANVGSKR